MWRILYLKILVRGTTAPLWKANDAKYSLSHLLKQTSIKRPRICQSQAHIPVLNQQLVKQRKRVHEEKSLAVKAKLSVTGVAEAIVSHENPG